MFPTLDYKIIHVLLAKRCVPHHWKVITTSVANESLNKKTVSIFWIGIHKRYSILYSTTITILSIFVLPLLEHYWHYDLFYGYNGFVYLITEIWESSKHHEMTWEQLHNGKKSIKINSGPETFIFSAIELIEICYTLL